MSYRLPSVRLPYVPRFEIFEPTDIRVNVAATQVANAVVIGSPGALAEALNQFTVNG